jgi:hypothetical protein
MIDITSLDNLSIKFDESKRETVGKAVQNILNGSREQCTTEDIIENYKQQYEKDFHKACEKGVELHYDTPFYILVLQNKEFWAENVVRNYFIPRQTPPHALDMVETYPHHNKILYMVNPHSNQIKICWNIPGYEDCKSILKNPQGLSKTMVNWIKDAMAGKFEKDSYEFDEVV